MSKAVIQVKNRQYIVEQGSKIQCDRLNGEPGSRLELPILGLFRDFGKTGVAHATILSHFLGEKRVALHKTPRGHDRHRSGSRPRLTLVQIDTFEGVN